MKSHIETVEESVSSLVSIHSQVRKIKRELEKMNHPTLIEQLEMRSVLREFSKSQDHFRSPLGISDRPILIDGDGGAGRGNGQLVVEGISCNTRKFGLIN
ncbi:unnamed protein product [Lactuca virosa]|uniref:Uncharacterized protein n=1 Tax=Lactuca virosa TaxID=75947 RepID=A0AAU9LZG6_9ASTR|nr:unnamed protein product [Lactuca virosa]